MRNAEWIDSHKYATPENLYSGEIGKIGNVRFVKTTEAKIFGPAAIVGTLGNGGYSRLHCKTAITASSTSITVSEIIPQAACTAFTTATNVYINGAANTLTAITYGAQGATLTIGTAITSLGAGDVICGKGAGKFGDAVFGTVVLGANAYAVTELSGGGLQHIVKQLGYGEDPLNQRSSSGWKATKVAKRLVEPYMVRIEATNSYSQKVESN